MTAVTSNRTKQNNSPGAAVAFPAGLPDSLALRDTTGLAMGAASSTPFSPARDETLAGQLLAVG